MQKRRRSQPMALGTAPNAQHVNPSSAVRHPSNLPFVTLSVDSLSTTIHILSSLDVAVRHTTWRIVSGALPLTGNCLPIALGHQRTNDDYPGELVLATTPTRQSHPPSISAPLQLRMAIAAQP